jgi:xylan 1,4-beta-xylosidase
MSQPSIAFESFVYRGSDPADSGIGSSDYLNPILAGFYPDPSICRVGDDFYLVNSTFTYFPGVPIFHSRDLVHWTQIGNILDRESQVGSMQNLPVSAGIYAPTLRYYAGRFYMITTLVGGRGNFVVWAENPSGPWSDPIDFKQIGGIDPSLFWDLDGRVYVVNNDLPPGRKQLYDGHCAIWLQQVDLETGQVIGEQKAIVDGGTDPGKKPQWIEGPHLLLHDGSYYLIAAEGGTNEGHSEVVFRSRNIWGPYVPGDGNPILTQRDLPTDRQNPITCTGHADLVQLADGKWWSVFLGCRPYEKHWYNTGRETFLLPVQWRDEWPVILDHQVPVPRVLPRPELPASPSTSPHTGSFEWKDDFTSDQLSPEWLFLRTPQRRWFEISNHSLKMMPRPVALQQRDNPSYIARRQQHANFSTEVMVRIEPRASDADAGLVAFQNETHHFFVGARIRSGRATAIFLEMLNQPEKDWRTAVPQIAAELQLTASSQHIRFQIVGGGRTHQVNYRLDNGGDWIPLKTDIDASFLSTTLAGGFQGVTLGMYARVTS